MKVRVLHPADSFHSLCEVEVTKEMDIIRLPVLEAGGNYIPSKEDLYKDIRGITVTAEINWNFDKRGGVCLADRATVVAADAEKIYYDDDIDRWAVRPEVFK